MCRMVILLSIETFRLQYCCCYHHLIYVFIHLWVIWVFTLILTNRHCTTLNSYWSSRTSVWRPFVGSLWPKNSYTQIDQETRKHSSRMRTARFPGSGWYDVISCLVPCSFKGMFGLGGSGPIEGYDTSPLPPPLWIGKYVLKHNLPATSSAGGNKRNRPVHGHLPLPCHGLFILPDTDSSTDSDSDSKPDQWKLHCTMQNISHCTDLDSDPYLFSDPHLLLYPFLATDFCTQIGIRVRVWQCK